MVNLETLTEKELAFCNRMYNSRFLHLPPYHCCVEYAKMMADGSAFEEYKAGTASDEDLMHLMFAAILRHETNCDINDSLRLVEIEKDLIPLVENTDNEHYTRPLFFPAIFINNEFKFDHLIIKGILIEECIIKNKQYILHSNLEPNNLVIFAIGLDPEQMVEYYTNIILDESIELRLNVTDLDDKEAKLVKRMSQFVRTIVANIIDMVEGNDNELTITTIATTREQNLKRVHRKQIQMPTKVFIRATGDLKRYISNNHSGWKLTHKFEVRGHWRRFLSAKFTNKQGEKTWIKPYMKGDGIKVKKEYIVAEG